MVGYKFGTVQINNKQKTMLSYNSHLVNYILLRMIIKYFQHTFGHVKRTNNVKMQWGKSTQ